MQSVYASTSIKVQSPKYLIYFVAAVTTFYLTQVVVLNRLIRIDTFYITGGCIIYFLSPLLIDVVAEVYGFRVAAKVIWAGLLGLLFMGLVMYIVLRMPSAPFWLPVTNAYNVALGSLPRTTLVGSIVIFSGQMINAFLISKWRVLTRGKYFWMRSVGSSIVGDMITMALGNIGVFSGRVEIHQLISIVFPQMMVVFLCSSLGSVPAAFLAKFIAKAEGRDNYQTDINFNPFANADNVSDT